MRTYCSTTPYGVGAEALACRSGRDRADRRDKAIGDPPEQILRRMRDLHAFLQLQKTGDPVLECDNFVVDDEGSGLLPWIAPMLATLTDERFSRQGWLFEPKWDGERCLAFRRGGDVRPFSRNRT